MRVLKKRIDRRNLPKVSATPLPPVAGTPQQSKRLRGAVACLSSSSSHQLGVSSSGGLFTLGVHFRLLCEETQFAEIGLFSGGGSPSADYSLGMGFPLASICFGCVAAERPS
ncbi:MAG: hypothetical protein AT707_02775 [Pyrobaculum sp. JCHS_4]|nr:MAG: hypothetical protein AT707_02775 [Pyrobaculum sp. JCHS_4]